MSEASPTGLSLFLLGPFEARVDGRPLPRHAWKRSKALQLLKLLALAPGGSLHKEQAIEALWPDAWPEAGANNLYRAVHDLRQVLEKGAPASQARFVTLGEGILRLDPGAWLDVQAFEEGLAQVAALRQKGTAESRRRLVELLEAVTALYRGELLTEDRFEEWASLRREELAQKFLGAAVELAAERRRLGQGQAALAVLRRALAQDPAYEPVHRELMATLAALGRRHEALRQYRALIEVLQAELGVPPSRDTEVLYEAIAAGAEAPPGPVVLAPASATRLTGRAQEMAAVRRALDGVEGGGGRVLLIAGEAGIGKTRLALEALGEARQRGFLTLSGASYEAEGETPFHPFLEGVAGYLAGLGRPAQESPFVAYAALGSPDPQQDKHRLFMAVAQFLVQEAAGRPAAFLVDDLHLADEATLQLFHFLARQGRGWPLLLVGTLREEEVEGSGTLATLVAALYRERLSHSLRLGSLGPRETAAILAGALGGAAAPALVEAIHGVSQGNPFFAQEVAQALRQEGRLIESPSGWALPEGDRIRVPRGLRSLLESQVGRLGAETRDLVELVSACGRSAEYRLLRAAASGEEVTLLDGLDEALHHRLLEETPEGYRVRHGLVGQAVYESLSLARRKHLHTRLARAYLQLQERRAASFEALAYHFDRSFEPEEAIRYHGLAAKQAANLYAFEAAVEHLERALQRMDELGIAEPRRRFGHLERLGVYYGILAHTPKAVTAFEQALRLRGPGFGISRRDEARMRRRTAMALITSGELEAAEEHLHLALKALENRPGAPELPHVLYNVAQLHWHRNEFQEAYQAAQRSLAAAEEADEAGAVARAFEMLALACHSLGQWQEGIRFEERRREVAGPALDVSDAFDVHL